MPSKVNSFQNTLNQVLTTLQISTEYNLERQNLIFSQKKNSKRAFPKFQCKPQNSSQDMIQSSNNNGALIQKLSHKTNSLPEVTAEVLNHGEVNIKHYQIK